MVLGTESFPEDTFWPVQNKMLEILKGEGVTFAEIFIDRTIPSQNAPTRKPGTAMLVKYLASGIDLNSSYVIGDRLTDVELAKNLGCKAILFSDKRSSEAELTSRDWNDIYKYLKQIPRTAAVERKTTETNIFRSNSILMDQEKVLLIQELDFSIICWNRLPGMEISILI